jgi:hypothetical protein
MEVRSMMRSSLRTLLFALVPLVLSACAGLQFGDPLQVTVAGVESLPGEGMELRMLVKLRVQNANDAPVEYDGVYVKLDVLEKTFATGVSDVRGSVPRFGEAVIAAPVTVSMLRMARHALGVLDGKPIDKITYEMEGKLNGPALGSTRFQSQGEFALPAAIAPKSAP